MDRSSFLSDMIGDDPWHVARVVLLVASAEAAGCTGTNFVVDAGVM